MEAPEKHDTAPVSLAEAKKELYDLKKGLFKLRRFHWVFWWGAGAILLGILAFYYDTGDWRFYVLTGGALVLLVLAVQAWKGKINPSIDRGSTNHIEEDLFQRRIAYLEGYIKSEGKKPGSGVQK